MIHVDLHLRIFLRALGLLSGLILAVTFVSGISSITHQREYAQTVYQGQLRALTLQMADLVLWDDRVALYKLMAGVVKKDGALGYAFLERNGTAYVHTFQTSVPRGLLGLGPFTQNEATVTPFRDQSGGEWLDVAQEIPGNEAALHLGVNVDVLFWQAIRGLGGVLAASLVALLAGTAFAWNIARATTREIRAREQAESEMRRSRDELSRANALLTERTRNLEHANKELEEFSYSVAHDLRGPLRAIDGFSHLLLDEYRDKVDEEGRRLLSVVRENTARVAELIDDLLEFTGMAQRDLIQTTVDMTALAGEAFDKVSSAAAGRKIDFRLGNLPPTAGDRALLRQVWTNLISNAVKFTATRVDAVIEVGGEAKGPENVYRIQDNGVGFDMRFIGKLFGVFQRLHGMDEFEGTGIGLAIVKRIVERHGGRVWAESTAGEGATFYFTLPASQDSFARNAC